MNSDLLKEKFNQYGITSPKFVRIQKESFESPGANIVSMGGFHNGLEYKILSREGKNVFFINHNGMYFMVYECEVEKNFTEKRGTAWSL